MAPGTRSASRPEDVVPARAGDGRRFERGRLTAHDGEDDVDEEVGANAEADGDGCEGKQGKARSSSVLGRDARERGREADGPSGGTKKPRKMMTPVIAWCFCGLKASFLGR
jgi:hypothetical protein